MTKSKTDAIHKQLVLKAAPTRVWQAISNAEQFFCLFSPESHSPTSRPAATSWA